MLISARNTWALYEIDQRTRRSHAGGSAARRSTLHARPRRRSSPTSTTPPGCPAATISVFDDEGAPPVNPPSRGEIVKLDTERQDGRRSRVSSCARPAPLTHRQPGQRAGAARRRLDGRLGRAAELHRIQRRRARSSTTPSCPRGENSYRVYREPWSAQPQRTAGDRRAHRAAPPTTVYASWNGATTVDLLAAARPAPSPPHSRPSRRRRAAASRRPSRHPRRRSYEVRALSASGQSARAPPRPVARRRLSDRRAADACASRPRRLRRRASCSSCCASRRWPSPRSASTPSRPPSARRAPGAATRARSTARPCFRAHACASRRCRAPTTPRRSTQISLLGAPAAALDPACACSGSDSGVAPRAPARLLAGRRRELRAVQAVLARARP